MVAVGCEECQEMTEPMLSMVEVSRRLGVSPQTVRRLIDDGQLRAINVGMGNRGNFRISQEDFRKFVASRQMKA
jgi:excisionase family DNA binding protein